MMLDKTTFLGIIKHTPLISIDLLVTDENNCLLLGYRNNRPAKNFWFVPGGRILKNETLSLAFSRLCKNELNIQHTIDNSRFAGVFEHFYADNFANKPNISTHYIVMAHHLSINRGHLNLPKAQHKKYQWVTIEQLEHDETIHINSRAYAQSLNDQLFNFHR